MIYDLPEEVRLGLERARKQDMGRKNRLRVHNGEDIFRVLRLWKDGFSMDAETAPHLRGRVDIYDSGRHLYQCLIMCSSVENGERVYQFKRLTAVVDEAPLDYSRADDAPVALLT